VGFEENFKWLDYKSRFHSFGGGELFAVNGARVKDRLVAGSPSGHGSYPESF
jgi:hypothetical protein